MKLLRKNNFSSRKIISLLLFAVFFSLSFFWQSIVPISSEAPDELQHAQIIYFLKKFKRPPVFDQDKEIFKTHFFKNGSNSGVYYSMAYNPPLPYISYVFLARNAENINSKEIIFPMRMISGLALGLFSVFLFLALSNFNQRKIYLALGISIFISFIPQVIFTSSYINIDPLSLFFSALSLYFLSKINSKSACRDYIFLGISLGLLALSKANYLIVVFFVSSLAIYQILKSIGSHREKYIKFIQLFIPIIILNSWWWIRNLILFDDPIIINHISSMIKNTAPEWFLTPRQEGANFLNILNHRNTSQTIFYGFFAYLGAFKVLIPLVFYYIFYFYLISFFLGGVIFIMKNKRSDLSVFLFSVFVIALSYFVFINKNLTDFSPQGRHLFPLLIPLSFMMLFSTKNWPRNIKKYFFQIWIIVALASNFYALLFFIRDYYITGSGWVATANWSGKIVSDFSYYNFSISNYQNLYRSIYSDAPAYWGYLSLFSAVLSIIFFVILLVKFLKNYDEKY